MNSPARPVFLPFKTHKIVGFFSRKKIIKKKYVCLPYLKFSNPLPETHLLPADYSIEISCLICYFLKKRQNLKLSSAENYRWRFKG